MAPDFRVVQLTPPGSACSIAIGTGIGTMAPGSLHGLHLCVDDIEAARAELVERGVDVERAVPLRRGRPDARARPGARGATRRS